MWPSTVWNGAGAEMCLFEFVGFTSEGVADGMFVHISSIEIDGAFDTVPHHRLILTLEGPEVEPCIVRYMSKWLNNRKFQARLSATAGRFFSNYREITRGVPRGGVISPLLRLLHSNKVNRHLHSLRAREPDILADISLLMTWPPRWCMQIGRNAVLIREVPLGLGLTQ